MRLVLLGLELDILVGSGGVLSHAPDRRQAAVMLVDAFQPEGVTRLAVDSVFMMPQLGALARLDEAAAIAVLEGKADATLGLRAMERIGDHACSVARNIIFSITGKDVRYASVEMLETRP